MYIRCKGEMEGIFECMKLISECLQLFLRFSKIFVIISFIVLSELLVLELFGDVVKPPQLVRLQPEVVFVPDPSINIEYFGTKQVGVFDFAHQVGNSLLYFVAEFTLDACEQFVDSEVARFLALAALAGRVELGQHIGHLVLIHEALALALLVG